MRSSSICLIQNLPCLAKSRSVNFYHHWGKHVSTTKCIVYIRELCHLPENPVVYRKTPWLFTYTKCIIYIQKLYYLPENPVVYPENPVVYRKTRFIRGRAAALTPAPPFGYRY